MIQLATSMGQSTLHNYFAPLTTRNPSKIRLVSNNGDDPSLVPGLTVIQDFITPLQETHLLAFLDGQPWRTDLARRTMHFGGTYCLVPKGNRSEARIKDEQSEKNLFRAQREQSLSSAASITYEQSEKKLSRAERESSLSRAQRESLSSAASIKYEQSEKKLSRAQRESSMSSARGTSRAEGELRTSNARISSEHSEHSPGSNGRPEIITAPPIPPEFASLLELFSTQGIYPASHPPGYCIVNEYLSSHGISAHVENYTFGEPVCSLTLHDGDHLRFHELSAPNDGSVRSGKAARAQRTGRKVDVWLAPRSLAVMRGDARMVWQHEVVRGKRGRVASRPGEEWRRTSLTFRVDR
jgi:alkylated DNA repair dioxygenase AlkB